MVGSIPASFSRQSFAHDSYQRGGAHHRRHDERGHGSRYSIGGVVVDLSGQAPQPFTAEALRTGIRAGRAIGSGQEAGGAGRNVRPDRVLTALAALEAMRVNPDTDQWVWPMGLPRPNEAELEAAYRKLTQRIRADEVAAGGEAAVAGVREERRRLVDHFRMTDFADLSAEMVLGAGPTGDE
ncbi:MAG: hypothetical protein ACOCX4_01150 [Planctomycetota bacterium]